jgi:hypothetical protein
MRGVISSALCLPNVLCVTNCDIAIIWKQKHKQSSLFYINSIDTRYHSVSKTDRINYLQTVHMTKVESIKCTILLFVKEMVDTNSDRIVGIELESHNYRSIVRSVLLLH